MTEASGVQGAPTRLNCSQAREGTRLDMVSRSEPLLKRWAHVICQANWPLVPADPAATAFVDAAHRQPLV